MKKSFINLLIITISILFLLSCEKEEGIKDDFSEKTELNDTEPVSVTFTGSINEKTYTPGEKASCEFNRIPKSFEKFIEMFEKTAVKPEGGAAMFILAMEIYRQNAALGEKCMAHCAYHKNATDNNKMPRHEMYIIRDKLRGTDNYAQPYISKAYYEGATPSNQYTPEKYKINFYMKPNSKYDPLSSAQSYVIPLKVKAYGKDWNNNPNRDHNMAVVKPAKQNYYLVFEFMDLFMGILEPDK